MKRTLFFIIVFMLDFTGYSQDRDLYFTNGTLKYAYQDFQGAIIEFSKAIELDSTWAQAYLERGMAKFHLKDYKGALEDFTRQLEYDRNPKNTLGYIKRGDAKYFLYDYKGAVDDYKKAKEINPKSAKQIEYLDYAMLEINPDSIKKNNEKLNKKNNEKLKGDTYVLNSGLQSKINSEDFVNLKFSLNATLVFDGQDSDRKRNTIRGKEYYFIEFFKKEICFSIDRSVYTSDWSYGLVDIRSECYFCESDDCSKTLVLTKKSNSNFKKVFKISNMNPFTLVTLE